MGVSLDQYRAAVGLFSPKLCKFTAYNNKREAGPLEVEDAGFQGFLPLLNISWKAATLALLLVILSPACLGSLLLIGGVESNPGPVTADSKKSVLAALCTGAPSSEIRDCLRCYDSSKSTAQIERKMNGISAPNLISTMTYLGVPGQECYVKSAIIRNLVCRIENLLPDMCFLCDREYTIAKDEVPLLKCASCGQGIHSPCLLQLLEVPPEHHDSFGPDEIQKKINPFNLPGFFYICSCCEKEKIPSDDNGKKKSHANRDESLNHTSSVGGAGQPDEMETEDPPDVAHAAGALSLEDESPTEAVDPIHGEQMGTEPRGPNNQQPYQQQRTQPENTRVNQRPNEYRNRSDQSVEAVRTLICSFYRKGTCRYGISGKGCSHSHPKPCRKLLQHGNKSPRGCNLGSKCSNFHPRICSSSLTRSECLNEKCTYPHIKGTRRSNTQALRVPSGRQTGHRPESRNARREPNEEKQPNHQEDFLGAIAVLKKELMDSFEKKLQSLQAQIQQVSTAEPVQFYPQPYRYLHRTAPHQITQVPPY